MSNLWLTLEVSPGSYIGDACKEAVAVADKIGVVVWFEFNGVKRRVRPGDSPVQLLASWERELKSSKPKR